MGWAIRVRVTGELGGEGRNLRASARMRAVGEMFGVEGGMRHAKGPMRNRERPGRRLWEGDAEVEIAAGEVVMICGASGTGKSTLLRRVEAGLRAAEAGAGVCARALRVLRLSEIALPENRAVVDCFSCSLQAAMGALARAGLSEARVLLRPPGALSEGEQFRFRLAQFMASDADVLVADAFGEPLDDLTARVVSWNLGKFIGGSLAAGRPRGAIVATVREELIADLQPDRVIWMRGGGEEK